MEPIQNTVWWQHQLDETYKIMTTNDSNVIHHRVMILADRLMDVNLSDMCGSLIATSAKIIIACRVSTVKWRMKAVNWFNCASKTPFLTMFDTNMYSVALKTIVSQAASCNEANWLRAHIFIFILHNNKSTFPLALDVMLHHAFLLETPHQYIPFPQCIVHLNQYYHTLSHPQRNNLISTLCSMLKSPAWEPNIQQCDGINLLVDACFRIDDVETVRVLYRAWVGESSVLPLHEPNEACLTVSDLHEMIIVYKLEWENDLVLTEAKDDVLMVAVDNFSRVRQKLQ